MDPATSPPGKVQADPEDAVIETVRGPIPAERLGATSMHEHLLADASRLQRPGAEPAPPGERVSPETVAYLRENMLALADNLRLDDAVLAAAELGRVRAHGQRSVVECTSWGLGPDHAGLPQISRTADVQIVVAYGAYIRSTLPAWVTDLDEAGLERHLHDALTVAVPGTHFRAGMLGIMGTTAGVPEPERGMLRAAARAAGAAGAAVSVRLDPDARDGLAVIDLMTGEGLSPERIVFTNGDEFMDAGYWADLTSAGAVVEMCFGTEAVHIGRVDNPTDAERFAFFTRFVAAHPGARHVLGGSLWTKAQLVRHGGGGYAHPLGRIAPLLTAAGMPAESLRRMTIDEPRRLLDR
jgi:phosphotriesterase-related protein